MKGVRKWSKIADKTVACACMSMYQNEQEKGHISRILFMNGKHYANMICGLEYTISIFSFCQDL